MRFGEGEVIEFNAVETIALGGGMGKEIATSYRFPPFTVKGPTSTNVVALTSVLGCAIVKKH